MRRLTLHEIGRLAGVSRSTVSRVINDQPNVSPEVKRRVLEVIESTGFEPNRAARSLVSARSGVLGLVIPSSIHAMFHDSYFTRLVHGATNAAAAADNMLALFLFESDREATELYPKAADNGLLDGLVVWASVASGLLVSLSAKSRIPFVTVGHPGTATVPYVEVEHYTGAVTGTRHLIGHGRREIAHLAVPLRTSAGAERRRGYLDAMSEAELKVGAGRVAEGDSTTGGGYRAMTELLDSRPDAVFCASDQMALGALRALDHAGVRCPDDVAVVSFDGLLAADEIDPPLTTVAQPVVETGEAAVQVLLEVLEGTRRVPSRLLPTELIVRSTCGCRSDPEQPGVPTDGSLHLGSESREP